MGSRRTIDNNAALHKLFQINGDQQAEQPPGCLKFTPDS